MGKDCSQADRVQYYVALNVERCQQDMASERDTWIAEIAAIRSARMPVENWIRERDPQARFQTELGRDLIPSIVVTSRSDVLAALQEISLRPREVRAAYVPPKCNTVLVGSAN